MSKELTEREQLIVDLVEQGFSFAEIGKKHLERPITRERVRQIYLKAQKKLNPPIMSKELKALESIKDFIDIECVSGYEKDLNTIEKALKALEIIKKRECLFKGLSETTQEEYDLLKEILL